MRVGATHRIRSLTGITGPCEDARSLLVEIARCRLSLRRAYGRHQMADPRWSTFQQYAVWSPVWRDGAFYGRLQGIVYLGVSSEIRWAECIGPLVGGTLRPIRTCLMHGDVIDHMRRAIDASDDLAGCDPQALSSVYNAIHLRRGFKSLVCRRGMQG
jgi:hypothetical protein